jgi:hypothetical protein
VLVDAIAVGIHFSCEVPPSRLVKISLLIRSRMIDIGERHLKEILSRCR